MVAVVLGHAAREEPREQLVGLDPVVERVDQAAYGVAAAGPGEEGRQVGFVDSHVRQRTVGEVTPTDLLTDAFGRVHESAAAVLDGLGDDAAAPPPGPRRQPDRLARLAPGAGAGRPRRRRGPATTRSTSTSSTASTCPTTPRRSATATPATTWRRSRRRPSCWRSTPTPCTSAPSPTSRRCRADDLDRVVDEHWDPPVTLGARLVSVVNDDTQHVGQAAYVRGLLGADLVQAVGRHVGDALVGEVGLAARRR